ncbi:putative necrosis-inducing factor-domain-containing protein [Daldinia grandis]|nr:putative necrosis-inducing factor-domain-containing protein [Daldinia grandis]
MNRFDIVYHYPYSRANMYLSTSIATALTASGLVSAVQLPNIDGTFMKREVQHPNGSTVDVYLRDSFRHANDKRFYQTFHNDTEYAHTEICFETNFVPTTTADSALCDDCSTIETELKAHSGFFETGDYSGTNLNLLAVCGTCAFGVKRLDGASARVDIGSKDVVDNFDSAIIRFARGGHVGVTGNFTCQSAPINWAIVRAP